MSDAVGAVGAVCYGLPPHAGQSQLESPPLAGIDKEAHPNPLLQTERVQQHRKFNVKLVRGSGSIGVSQRGEGRQMNDL